MQQNTVILRIKAMGTNYERLFQVLPQESAPAYLCERIFEAILRERDRNSILWERSRLVFSSLTGAGSLWGLAFALPALMRASDASGFTTFASLFVSDSDLLASHFSTFALSLLEALPGLEVTVTFSCSRSFSYRSRISCVASFLSVPYYYLSLF